MEPSSPSFEPQRRLEDVLSHLPAVSTTDYSRGQVVYGPNSGSKNIYLVVAGKVGISRIAHNGSEVLLEIVQTDELFGESAFLDDPRHCEQATAVQNAKLMSWAVSDIEDLVVKRPRLAVALLQIFAQRNAELSLRIESLSVDTIERRLARSLLGLSERLGALEEDGYVQMMPLTHTMLAQYIGTSRELVSHYMGRFRKSGYLDYSRRAIRLRQEALRAVLDGAGCASAATGSELN